MGAAYAAPFAVIICSIRLWLDTRSGCWILRLMRSSGLAASHFGQMGLSCMYNSVGSPQTEQFDIAGTPFKADRTI